MITIEWRKLRIKDTKIKQEAARTVAKTSQLTWSAVLYEATFFMSGI